jgi:hypothetical protein
MRGCSSEAMARLRTAIWHDSFCLVMTGRSLRGSLLSKVRVRWYTKSPP